MTLWNVVEFVAFAVVFWLAGVALIRTVVDDDMLIGILIVFIIPVVAISLALRLVG